MSENRLRPMNQDDLQMVLDWRNHPSIREHMYSRDIITLAEHTNWFDQMSKRPDVELLIFELAGTPIGYTKLDFNPEENSAEWGFYASPQAPPGTGTKLGQAVLAHAFANQNLALLKAEVIASNVKSLRFHKKMGFQQYKIVEKAFFDGANHHDIVYMNITSAMWQKTA